MKYKNKLVLNFVLIFISILLLSFMDFIVLEKIYHPLSSQHNISFKEFNAVLFNYEMPMLWWHVAFFPLAFILFILLGIASRNWRLSLSGIILFLTGWEDIFYYLIQLRWLPYNMPWLDPTPVVGLTRFILPGEYVTSTGVLLCSIIGLIISTLIITKTNPVKIIKINKEQKINSSL